MLDESIFEKKAGPGKGFYCESGQTFNSIRELEEALLKCNSEESRKMFDAHVEGYKNDFSAWIGDVFGFRNLAQRIFSIKDPAKLSDELRKYELEISQKNQNVEEKTSEKLSEKSSVETKEQKVQQAQMPKNNANNAGAVGSSSDNMDSLRTEMNDRSDRADNTFNRVKKIKQHSLFNKSEFDDTIEDVQERYEELKKIVAVHRKDGKDMSIPDMMLRNIRPKINYFQVSQNVSDHEMIVELLDEVEQEIKYAIGIKKKDLREEIMEALGFSKIKKED